MTGCSACGEPASNAHHVMQKGSPYMGDDVPENIVLVCGSGTTGCHGAWHGSPYVVERDGVKQRRDQEWVAMRIGRHLLKHRPETIEYVIRKLGLDAAFSFLERSYFVSPVELVMWRERYVVVRPHGSRG